MGIFSGGKAIPGLRGIANLYPEAVHVVVREDSRIRAIGDLRRKRVSLDLKGSGTRSIANLVLMAHGVDPKSLRRRDSQVGPAVDRLQVGGIDAFFFVGGFPAPSIARLAREVPLRLLPITGEQAAAIRKTNPFLAVVTIPPSVYGRMAATTTLAVGALWTISDKVSADLVYGITRALWHPTSRLILDQGPPATRQMRLKNALKGVAIPLHEGARRFYREKGLMAKSPPEVKPGTTEKPAPKAKPESPAQPAPKS